MAISKQLKHRLVVGSLTALFIFTLIYFSYTPFFKPFFVLIAATIIALALIEYYYLTQTKGLNPLIELGTTCSVLYIIAVYISVQYPTVLPLPSFILWMFLFSFFVAFFKNQPNPITNIAVTLFGIAYLTLPLSFAIKLNYLQIPQSEQDGRLWLAYALAVTKLTDIGAYFFGMFLGKHKLAPHISPQKTVEGAIGGIVLAIAGSLAFHFISQNFFPNSFTLTGWKSIGVGLLVSIVAQFGDLAESLLKRDAGVKDSNRLPGVGGILDVVDSLIFTLPLVFFMLKAGLIGHEALT